MEDYNAIINAYKDVPGGLIEAYHALQRSFNYIPEDSIDKAAEVFNLSKARAYGVASFYSYFNIGKKGKYIVRICESAPCHIAGANKVVEALEKELGIKMGETTNDGKFTLEFTECVGQCQATPVITINSKPYIDVSAEKIPAILKELA
ncbi:MAG: NAD(P)H-dependent oxidoreductase subunit E [Bacillota bacterium]|nr:NAD(P)H-dependent oxidoreductase subunit E [Bacillota bacterium]